MNICVFGASSDRIEKAYFEEAYALGVLIAREDHRLIFGGGNEGLMGACARGVLSEGGRPLGIAPRFFDEPGILFSRCSRMIFTETMHERKQVMEDGSDAFLVLPGGIGTLEEFFETLTLKQLGRHGKPIAIVNTLQYYDALLALLHAAADGGFMSRSCLRLFSFCDTPQEALDAVVHAETLSGSIRRLADYNQ